MHWNACLLLLGCASLNEENCMVCPLAQQQQYIMDVDANIHWHRKNQIMMVCKQNNSIIQIVAIQNMFCSAKIKGTHSHSCVCALRFKLSQRCLPINFGQW